MIKKAVVIIMILALTLNLLPIYASDNFETNMENWKGIESTWTDTASGFKDGSEQTVFDFALSDSVVDGSKDFLYTVEYKKESGYGAGMILGVKDGKDRASISKAYIYFIADTANVYYSVFVDNNVVVGPIGRPMTEDELSETITLTAQFDSTSGTIEFSINGNYVGNYANTDAIKGRLGLIAHDASVSFTKANLAFNSDTEETPFQTNMSGWKGIESSWKETPKGYIDGNEQSMFDFSMSDVYVDGTKSFIYEAEIMRVNGYGFGLLFGVTNKENRSKILENYTIYIVDLKSVLFNRNQTENVARALTEDELDPKVKDSNEKAMVYKLKLEYFVEDEYATLYLNDNYVNVIDDVEIIKGYLGLVAHDATIRVLSAKYEEVTYTPAPSVEKTPEATATNTVKPTATTAATPVKESNPIPYIIIAVVAIAIILVIVIVIRKKRIS
jgi:hypothetical protein